MLGAAFKFWIIAPFGFWTSVCTSFYSHRQRENMHLQDYCTDVNEINGKGSRRTKDCWEVGRMFWQVGQFAIHLSNVRQKNMAFSTAADLCHTLLGRCSCLQMRSTHTHTHTHKLKASCCSFSCRPSARSTVLLKWHDFCFSKMQDATYVFSQCFNLLVQNELVGKLFYIVCKTTRKRCLG